jgi:hypothetical protein
MLKMSDLLLINREELTFKCTINLERCLAFKVLAAQMMTHRLPDIVFLQ